MNQREGYLVFFMPGSCGRLFGSIIYKLINNISTTFPITEYNSAHHFKDATTIHFAMRSQADVGRFATGSSIVGDKLVVVSHLYPEEGIEELCKITDKGIVLVNVKKKYVPETLLNAAIKNILPPLQQSIDNKILPKQDDELMKMYKEQYHRLSSNTLDTTILTDPNKMYEFLKFFSGEAYTEKTSLYFSPFVDSTVQENEQVFRIEYDEMFDKNSTGQYTTLVRLADWLCVEYDSDVHKIYHDYEIGQVKLFEKYCPWFLTGEEDEPR